MRGRYPHVVCLTKAKSLINSARHQTGIANLGKPHSLLSHMLTRAAEEKFMLRQIQPSDNGTKPLNSQVRSVLSTRLVLQFTKYSLLLHLNSNAKRKTEQV